MYGLKFNRILEIGDIENLSNNLLGHKKLPSYLFLKEKYTKIVIEMKEENESAGLSYGVIEHDSNMLFLHFLFVKKEYRSYVSVLSLLESTFKLAIDIREVKNAVWKYTLSIDESDLRLNLLLDIPFCHFRKVQYAEQFRIETANINFIRQFKIYAPTLWQSKGYDVIKWRNCEKKLLSKIREMEKSIDLDKSYITPFNKNDTDDGNKYNKHYSYILVNEENKPQGWIMCSTISNKEVMIRNFYMYPEARASIIAHSFATYILDIIAQELKYLSFDVIDGNRQMEMIAEKYFKPIIKNNNIQCYAYIDFKVEC